MQDFAEVLLGAETEDNLTETLYCSAIREQSWYNHIFYVGSS